MQVRGRVSLEIDLAVPPRSFGAVLARHELPATLVSLVVLVLAGVALV